MDDAMEQWARELEAARGAPPASQSPPGWRRRLADRERRRAPEGFAGLAGALVTAAVVLLDGFPPDLGPLYLAGPVLGALVGRLIGSSGLRALSGAVVASLAGLVTFMLLVPALALLDFIECWASWLSDC